MSSNLDKAIEQIIEQHKMDNHGINDSYWDNLKIEIKKDNINELYELLIPVFKKHYTNDEIKALIRFSNTKEGKSISKKQYDLTQDILKFAMEWMQLIDGKILNAIKDSDNTEITNNDIQRFENEFVSKNEVEIINIRDLKIDNKHNIGSILIDFGKGKKKDLEHYIEIKNISDKNLEIKEHDFINTFNKEVTIDWGDKSIKPNEIRKIYFRLNLDYAEGNKYYNLALSSNLNFQLMVGIQFDLPNKDLEYKISKKKLKYHSFETDYSKPYVFTITNEGKRSFKIVNVKMDNEFCYTNLNRKIVKPNETVEISFVFSKELINKNKLNNIELNITVELSKNIDEYGFNHPNAKIELKIK